MYTCTVANNKPSNASATQECEVVCNLVEIVYCRAFSSDPVQPIIILMVKSATSLNINWEVTNATDDTYTVEWKKRGCLAENEENSDSITTNDTSYSITGLEDGSKYNITVSAGKLSNTVSAVTIEKGQGVVLMSYNAFSNFISLAPSAAPRVSWTFATSYSIVESVVISTNDLIDSIFKSSSKMRRRMVYGEGLTGRNRGQGNLVHLLLVH